MIQTLDVLRLLQGAIVVLGMIVVYYSYKGYRRSNNKPLLFLALGFMFVTIGGVAAGFLFELLSYNLITVEVVEAGSQVVGFALIVYSIIGTRD